MELKDTLKQIREKNGLTKRELCEKTGISERAYLTYEFGEREPKISVIQKLADFYGVPTDYLLGREPAPDDPIEMLSRELNLNLYEKAIVTAYLAMDTKSRTDLVKMVQTVADAVQSGTESKYTYTIQVAARGDAAKSRQEQGEDVTVSTTLGAVEDQMEETAKAKEEASS